MEPNEGRASEDAPEEWVKRIGTEAAIYWWKALHYKRIGGTCTLAFVLFEIGFQVANIQLGVELSVLWFIASIYFFFRSYRTTSVTRHLAANYLGSPEAARYIPLVYTDVFDKWINARNTPGWPRKGWRR